MSLHPPINSHLSFPHPPSTPSSSSSRRLSQSPGVKLKYGTTRPLLGIMSSVQRRASSAILKSHQDETKSVHRRNLSTASAGTKRPLGHARVVSISDKSTFISHHRERFPHLHEVHDSAIKDDFISSHAENFPYLHGKAAENAEGDLTEKLKQEREAGKVKRQSLRLDNAKDGQLQGQEWEDGIKPKLRPLSLRLPVKSISVPSSPLLSNPASEPGVLDGGRAATEDAVSNSKPETQPVSDHDSHPRSLTEIIFRLCRFGHPRLRHLLRLQPRIPPCKTRPTPGLQNAPFPPTSSEWLLTYSHRPRSWTHQYPRRS